MPAESLNHYTIQARDMEKTKDFYRDIVGLTVGDRPPLSRENPAGPLGAPSGNPAEDPRGQKRSQPRLG